MANFWSILLVLTYAALFWWTIQIGQFWIFVVAFLGSALTVGLTKGSLAPLWPAVPRRTRPVIFWTAMAVCAVLVAFNIVILVWRR